VNQVPGPIESVASGVNVIANADYVFGQRLRGSHDSAPKQRLEECRHWTFVSKEETKSLDATTSSPRAILPFGDETS